MTFCSPSIHILATCSVFQHHYWCWHRH